MTARRTRKRATTPTPTKAVGKNVSVDLPFDPPTVPRIGFNGGKDSVNVHGSTVPPQHWWYVDADGSVAYERCLTTLLTDYVDNAYQNNDLLIKLARVYADATGAKL